MSHPVLPYQMPKSESWFGIGKMQPPSTSKYNTTKSTRTRAIEEHCSQQPTKQYHNHNTNRQHKERTTTDRKRTQKKNNDRFELTISSSKMKYNSYCTISHNCCVKSYMFIIDSSILISFVLHSSCPVSLSLLCLSMSTVVLLVVLLCYAFLLLCYCCC